MVHAKRFTAELLAGYAPRVGFAENIRAERFARRMTQAEFSDAYGLTQGAISKWEAGKTTPGASDLFDLAQRLGVTMDALMSGEPRATVPLPPPTKHEARTTPDRRALKLFRLISDEGQRHALGALAAFAKAYPRRRAQPPGPPRGPRRAGSDGAG